MKIRTIYSIQNKGISNEDIVKSILNTYQKIKDGYPIESLFKEDIQNIKNFYSYLTINSAIGMLSNIHRNLAYQEMQNYVGNYSYPIEMKKAFLEKYIELLNYTKSIKEDTLLKRA